MPNILDICSYWYHEKQPRIPEMTKREAYQLGHYAFEVPPGATGQWDDDSWIKWIDSHGRWLAPLTE